MKSQDTKLTEKLSDSELHSVSGGFSFSEIQAYSDTVNTLIQNYGDTALSMVGEYGNEALDAVDSLNGMIQNPLQAIVNA